MTKDYAPVVVFAYNRSDKLKNCIKYLENCPEARYTDLYIFCDGYKGDRDRDDVLNVHSFAHEYAIHSEFRTVTVRTQEINRGLAASIIGGVTEVINEYGRVIVVEDDLIVLPSFLKFLNEGLDHYQNDKKFGSISAFTYPMKCLTDYDKDMYATRKAECWGWATWADRWDDAKWKDVDYSGYFRNLKLRLSFERLEAGIERLMYLQYKGRIDSWAVRWIYYLFQNGQLTVYPSRSRVINDGFDGSGTHFTDRAGKDYNSPEALSGSAEDIVWEECRYNKRLEREYARYPRGAFLVYLLGTVSYLIKGLLIVKNNE